MSEDRRIAGHLFRLDWLGREQCVCGVWWHEIAGATKQDIGAPGWAHIGQLLDTEYEQIAAERERRWNAGLGRAEAAL